MVKFTVKLVIIIFSLFFVGLLVTLFISESIEMNKEKEKSLEHFIFIRNSLNDGGILSLSSILLNYNGNMPNLRSVYIENEKNTPIYFFSTNNKDTLQDISNFFINSNSIFNTYYNQEIEDSTNIYKLDAAFSILSENRIYQILKKLTLLILLYFFILVSLIIYTYSKKNRTNKYTEEKVDIYSFSEQKITNELKKSASFDHDIVLVLIGAPHKHIRENCSEFSDFLKEHFPFQDLIYRYDKNTFCILLPNIDLEKGIQQIENFDQTFVNISSKSLKFPIMFGLSSRNGRLISGNIILKEAKVALKKAMSDKSYPIVGFRPNPALYREYISKIQQKN